MRAALHTEAARRDERGAVAGGETLAVALLVLICGALALTNVWAIVETRTALDSAAREYLRTYTHAGDGATAARSAEEAARSALRHRGTPLADLHIAGPDPTRFGPCELATVELSIELPWARVPFIDDVGARTVRVVHSELIDPHREMTAGDDHDPARTPCRESMSAP